MQWKFLKAVERGVRVEAALVRVSVRRRGSRPLDMVLCKKDGKEYLLMSNNSRGVMKIPTADFGTATPITAKVTSETAGIKYETIATMKGVEQMDLLDGQRSLVLARAGSGLNLSAVALP